jgi:hypothetical protein
VHTTAPPPAGQIARGALHAAHAKFWQAPEPQAKPHWPQFWGSLLVSVQ